MLLTSATNNLSPCYYESHAPPALYYCTYAVETNHLFATTLSNRYERGDDKHRREKDPHSIGTHYKSPKPYLLTFRRNILIKETIHELDKSFGKNMK